VPDRAAAQATGRLRVHRENTGGAAVVATPDGQQHQQTKVLGSAGGATTMSDKAVGGARLQWRELHAQVFERWHLAFGDLVNS
jgi:hypothetical protein